MSEMRRKLEAVDQAMQHVENALYVSPAKSESEIRRRFSDAREAVAKAIITCAREDKARHVRQQRGGSDE